MKWGDVTPEDEGKAANVSELVVWENDSWRNVYSGVIVYQDDTPFLKVGRSMRHAFAKDYDVQISQPLTDEELDQRLAEAKQRRDALLRDSL